MLEQTGNVLLIFGFFCDSTGVGVTGLTVTVDAYRVVNSAGTPSPTTILTGASATEIGGGFYGKVIASADNTAEGAIIALFKTTSTSVRDKQIPSAWAINVAGIEDLDATITSVKALLPAALVSGRIDASVGAMATNTLTASSLATDAVNEIVDQVWDEAISGHLTAGTVGEALDDAQAGVAGGQLTIENLVIGGVDYEFYGTLHDETLGAGEFSLDIPNLAEAIMLQTTGEDIYVTWDGDTPSASVGMALIHGFGWQVLSLSDDKEDTPFKFLRSTNGAILHYQFLRKK